MKTIFTVLLIGMSSFAINGAFAQQTIQDTNLNADTGFIIGGSTVNSNDPVASTTVLIYGTVPAQSQAKPAGRLVQLSDETAAALDGVSTELKKRPVPTHADDPAPASSPAPAKDSGYICTGSLIAADIVVTAAHCVTALPQNIRLIFDTDMNNINAQNAAQKVRGITGYLANPKYATDTTAAQDEGDIAILHISGSLPSGYHTAQLYTGSPKKGDSVLLAGYGITDAQTQDGAGTLRDVSGIKVAKPFGNTETELDQRNGKGACHGDSGGPAFAQNGNSLLLWGVTSRGYPNTQAGAECEQYVIYTQINAYSSWISQAEQQLRNGR